MMLHLTASQQQLMYGVPLQCRSWNETLQCTIHVFGVDNTGASTSWGLGSMYAVTGISAGDKKGNDSVQSQTYKVPATNYD